MRVGIAQHAQPPSGMDTRISVPGGLFYFDQPGRDRADQRAVFGRIAGRSAASPG